MSLGIDSALPDKRATRRAFDRAADFDSACFIHDAARERLLERLELVNLTPRIVVDLGCATGRGAAALAARYAGARVLAVDASTGMLRATRRAVAAAASRRSAVTPSGCRCARTPSTSCSRTSCCPGVDRDTVFAEAARVLAPGGVLLFATLGPDSLSEIRRAFAAVDNGIHVHAAFDMHDLGDLALKAGLAEPVLDVDRLTVTYASRPPCGAI